jgi:cation diffusion facilitator CzcD-associated flavoprotein CzcO
MAATGLLSAHYIPQFEGLESFKGDWFHTSRWPHQDPQLAGKRVGVIGTGATAVQLITEIAKVVGHLTVFQRTPNYCAPLRNAPIDADTQAKIKASYPDIFRRTRESFAGFLHNFDTRSFFDVPAEKRKELYEELWKQPGFAKWLGNFPEIMTNLEANEEYAEFVRAKIRERVKDPAVAEKLVPKDHPFGSKRIPLESGYYEVFNRDNVTLVDIRESPIERITPSGLKTRDAEYPFDVIIFATGFDAITGPLTRMDIRGENQQSLKDRWVDGPRSYLGIQVAGFPNFFIANAATFCNVPRCLEMVVDWISDCISNINRRGLARIAPSMESEQAWTDHVNELAASTLLTKADSWFMGANIPGKARAILLYANSAPAYRQKLQEVAENNYEGFVLS